MKKILLIPLFSLLFGAAQSMNPAWEEIQKEAQEFFPNKKKIKVKGFKHPSNVILIDCGDKKYIMRKFSQRDSGEKRLAEIQLAQKVSEAGYGPAFVGVPKNGEFYIVECAGKHISYKNLSEECLRKIGKIIRKIHDFSFPIEGFSQKERLKKVYERCQRNSIALPSDFKKVYEAYYAVKEEPDSPYVGFCHGNLAPQNIRINDEGKITFINWRYAGKGNTMEDLGYFAVTNGLEEEQVRIFFEAYLNRAATDKEMQEFKNAMKRSCLLLATQCFEFSTTSDEKQKDVKERTEALDKECSDANIKNILLYPQASRIFPCYNEKMLREYAISAWKTYKDSNETKEGVISKFCSWFKNLVA